MSIGKEVITTSVVANDPDWDAFVTSELTGHHEQTQDWGQIKRSQNWETKTLVVRSGNEIVGGALILQRRVKGLFTLGYVAHGPLCRSDSQERSAHVVEELDRFARRCRIAYLVVIPPYFSDPVVRRLGELGFRKKPDALPPHNETGHTLMLDLNQSLDDLMAQTRLGTRNKIKKGIRSGFRMRQGGYRDLDTFRDLMWSLCERRGIQPVPPQKDYFHKAWSVLEPKGHVGVFFSELQGRPVSAVFAFTSGKTFRAWKGGWTGEHPKSQPNHALLWDLICWSKAKGYRFFDLVQIIPEHAEAIMKGEPLTGPYTGVTEFKLGFGGELVPAQTVFKSYNPIVALCFKLGGLRFLESPLGRRLLNRLSATI